MKTKTLLLLPVSAICLMGCQPQSNDDKPYLYDGSSRLVIQSFGDENTVPMPTYRLKKTGEVPYSDVADFFYANCAIGVVKTKVTHQEGIYLVQDDSGRPFASFDPAKDVFTVENYEYWNSLSKLNNGVGPDLGAVDETPQGAVHPGKSSKYLGERKKEVYELSKYNIDIVENDGHCYVPTAFLANTYYRWIGNDLAYNGLDYYLSGVLASGTISVINASFYATKDRFMALEGVDAVAYDPVGEESYRYAYPVTKEDKTIYRILSLTKDGKGKLLTASSPKEAGKEEPIDGVNVSYAWQKKEDALLVNVTYSMVDPNTNQTISVPKGTQKIPLKEGFYKSNRSKQMADFTYDLLRFQFDHYYGLKDVAGYQDFDAYASSKGLKDGLHSLDNDTYNKALATLLMTHIDDGHTQYSLPSIFSGKTKSDGQKLAGETLGNRFKTLGQKRAEYMALREKTMGAPEGTNLQGYFTKGNTAVIRFDGFDAPGTIVANVKPEDMETLDPLSYIANGDIPAAFDASFYRIGKNKDIKNVVIDLTCNGGGSVMVIPYIAAHFSKDPTIYSEDIAMGVKKEFHYAVDLNHDQIYGGEGDSYEGKYTFYVLTSDFSFSCASFLPAVAKSAGVKIIGKKSGGGACSVGAFSDGCGSVYNISSPQRTLYKVGDSFAHIDAGVPLDHELDSASWYNLDALNTFLNNLGK
ncbi:MAG: hypothetical protein K6E59_00580 [Bacilli bacterium]|nr:hypothetical protein [Bacilli bacterium]